MIPPLQLLAPLVWRDGACRGVAERAVPEETAIALTFGRETYAVMMATPADLEDFAIGFALTEQVIAAPDEIASLAVREYPDGIELRMELAGGRQAALTARRRRLAGPTGCGLCGVDSLAEAVRPPPPVPPGRRVSAAEIAQALAALGPRQTLNAATRSVHAAALWRPGHPLLLREDVGRHNALDKLVGAAARAGIAAADSMVILTSRVSIEMVQKAAVLGAPVLVAISAPTAHAVRLAEAAGMTLVAVARGDGFEVFTGGGRIVERAETEPADAA